uniref:EF-hand domain-containing protein n=1 Tax=Cryptomonas curvata TaxID=233186 RepID=A0A7S0N865_9CRYP|mmetsp:Transcript_8956/g.19245  ORF Transcript_8956/g.19245 Transcript_8956/m.19245 type:complete len:145 (+) Transcript_8956:35-469(+)
MEVLLPEQIEELLNIFRSFDTQGKQSLSARELGACFKCFGYIATEADLNETVNEVGGVVDFMQFVHIMTKKMKDCDALAEIQAAYRAFDKDTDGNVGREELARTFARLSGHELPPEEIDELLREADVDGDGRISQLDFINVLTT